MPLPAETLEVMRGGPLRAELEARYRIDRARRLEAGELMPPGESAYTHSGYAQRIASDSASTCLPSSLVSSVTSDPRGGGTERGGPPPFDVEGELSSGVEATIAGLRARFASEPASFLDPATWLGAVERETEAHRRSRALAHDGRRWEVLAAAGLIRPTAEACSMPAGWTLETVPEPGAGVVDLDGRPELADRSDRRLRSARWHKGRARGALERFRTVRDCGRDQIEIRCRCCGKSRRKPSTCGVVRLCVACRARAALRRQGRAVRARSRLFKQAARLGLLHRVRWGGRWSEKHLVLTIPHVLGDAWLSEGGEQSIVAHRVRIVLQAWRWFSLRLATWGRKVPRPHSIRPVFYGSFEWTPGRDGAGHPHVHLWVFGPFLPIDLVREWWRWAVERVGGELPPARELSTPASCAGVWSPSVACRVPWVWSARRRLEVAALGVELGARCVPRVVRARASSSPCSMPSPVEVRTARTVRTIWREAIAGAPLVPLAPAIPSHVRAPGSAARCRRGRRIVGRPGGSCVLGTFPARCVSFGRRGRRNLGGHPDRCARPSSLLIVWFSELGRGAELQREVLHRDSLALPGVGGGKAASDLQTYLDGWSIVDVDQTGERISPVVAARLYESLEGRRLVHATRGFLDPPHEAACPTCEVRGSMHAYPVVRPVESRELAPLARAGPWGGHPAPTPPS